MTTRMNTIRRTRRCARSLSSSSLSLRRLSLFVLPRASDDEVSSSLASRRKRTLIQIDLCDKRHERDREKKKFPAPAWLHLALIRTGIWRGVNRSASRYGENGESFSSHAPRFFPADRTCRRSIVRACENIFPRREFRGQPLSRPPWKFG